jgi:hypothetical protein
MPDRSNERGRWDQGPRLGPGQRHDWDEAAGDHDPSGEGRSFDKGPRQGGGGAYTGRGYTGGYGQNGTDPGERVSPYGDRIYRGDGGRQEHPGEHRAYHDPGHRGLGPQGYRRSDQRISEDVHDRLTDDDHLDASGISVAVQDGEVTLSGTIRDRRAKHHAEAIIEHIGGVQHVQNNLRVEASAGRTPAPLGENTILRDQAEGES